MKKIILVVAFLVCCSLSASAYDYEFVDVVDEDGNRYEGIEEDWGSWKEVTIMDNPGARAYKRQQYERKQRELQEQRAKEQWRRNFDVEMLKWRSGESQD